MDRLDFAVTFFQNCYHLRDWIPIIEQIDKNDWNKNWEDFIKNRIEMKICRDICNGTKHLKLNSPSVDGNFSIFLEYEPYHEVLNERQTEWKILVNGQKYSFLDLMNGCLNAWNEFVTKELKNIKK